ncbi:hypothetical protein R5R35_006124 [Gryllus longicercus]|uniref:Uncharacterized protein n=1 Tax=Gryllus longicercus TaxID=2509291 RepID=A0AAN9V440_9ORTH
MIIYVNGLSSLRRRRRTAATTATAAAAAAGRAASGSWSRVERGHARSRVASPACASGPATANAAAAAAAGSSSRESTTYPAEATWANSNEQKLLSTFSHQNSQVQSV